MQDFSQLAKQMHAQFPTQHELWTSYHLEVNLYAKCSFDWGPCLAYHFDRGVSINTWLEMVEHVRGWVESQPNLQQIIGFVPFYEVGADFFTQCKPPYDGGYPTTKYAEFLYHRDCAPAPWFFQQLAQLQERVVEALPTAQNSAMEALLSRIVHATFITPYEHVFWLDEEGWAVFQPNIGVSDVREWEKLSHW
jgi:hypothetical protein